MRNTVRPLLAVFFSISLSVLSGCAPQSAVTPDQQFQGAVKSSSQSGLDPETERNSEAMHSYLVGELAYDSEDFKRAVKSFERASTLIDNPVPTLHAKLAELYVRDKDLEKALAESQRAIEGDPTNAQHLLLQAGILEALQRSGEAKPLYEQVIARQPKQPDAYLLLSNLYIRDKQFDSAIDVLQRFAAAAPSNDPEPQYYLGAAHEMKGDLVLAEKHLLRAHQLAPANPSVGLDLVRVYLKKKDYTRAKSLCAAIIEKSPENAVARRIMGQLLIGENKLDEALEHLKVLQGVEEDPTETRYKIALILIEKQSFQEAIRELNLVLAQKPSHTQARYYLGSVYAGIGQRKEAVEELEKIPVDDSLYVKSRTLAAFILRQDGDLEGAERVVRQALKAQPDDESLLSYLILILRDARKAAQAEKLLASALDKHPQDEKLLFAYATVLHDLDREEEARAQIERVLAQNAKHADALNYLAYSLAEDQKDLDRALELVTRALALKPNDGYYLDTLGWVHYQRGDYQAAEEALSRAVTIVADDPVIIEHYADVLVKRGRADRAMELYRTALERARNSKDKEQQDAAKRIEKKLAPKQ